jgi:hypothetical protein
MKTFSLDLDGKNGLDTFLSRRWVMKYLGLKVGEPNEALWQEFPKRYMNVPQVSVRVWHTINGWHLEVDLDNEISNLKAILMQGILGDDYRRTVALLQRIERGCKNWNRLYRTKYKVNELGQRVQVSFERFDPDLSQKVLDLLELGE